MAHNQMSVVPTWQQSDAAFTLPGLAVLEAEEIPGEQSEISRRVFAQSASGLINLAAPSTLNESSAPPEATSGELENVIESLQRDLEVVMTSLCDTLKKSFSDEIRTCLSTLEADVIACAAPQRQESDQEYSAGKKPMLLQPERRPSAALSVRSNLSRPGMTRSVTTCTRMAERKIPKSRTPIVLPTAALQLAAMESALARGRPETAEVFLAAGFLGGGGFDMQACWLLAGCLLCGSAFLDTSLPFEVGSCGSLCGFLSFNHKMTMISTGAMFCARGCCLLLRRYAEAQSALLVATCLGAQAFFVIGLPSIYLTMEHGCTWRDDRYLFHEGTSACAWLGGMDAVLLTAQGLPLAWMTRALLYTQLKEAAQLFLTFFAIVMVHSYFRLFSALALGGDSMLRIPQFCLIIFCTKCGLLATSYRRHLARRKAWELVADDATAYDKAWADVVVHHRGSIELLSEAANEVAADVRAAAQEGTRGDLSDAENQRRTLLQYGDVKSGALQQDLMSLPLLYAQAFAMNNHFQRKCSEWASDLGTYTPGVVKQPRRAVQKIWRTYGGQPQCLVDLVRASIICEKPSSLQTLLDRIRDDDTAKILRIKNRFDLAYDSNLSAGFRSLTLNFIIIDQRTRSISTDRHICELQLGLETMHDLKTDGGHSRFVAFRDGRAE
eukprot:TRINITY_DN10217_c0_g2_i1.p1 TRINITY_DN10217_c0_g2~~TRINITY_DN10217_c0_g2_i1.p1  ORF type:complete len:667 (+),score=76.57 TRINITY_DN10217_c0_g2_i1:157-2157(+)